MYGLQKGSQLKEILARVGEDLAVRYKVVEEAIDLVALRREKERLEGRLEEPEPSNEELMEAGRESHGYYEMDREGIGERLAEIDAILDIPTEL